MCKRNGRANKINRNVNKQKQTNMVERFRTKIRITVLTVNVNIIITAKI